MEKIVIGKIMSQSANNGEGKILSLIELAEKINEIIDVVEDIGRTLRVVYKNLPD